MYIYGLVDPRINIVRYVGVTNNIRERMNGHLSLARRSTKSHKSAWIKGLLNINLKPKLVVLAEVSDDKWEAAEKFYIKVFQSFSNLLNLAPAGGYGPRGYRHTAETKERIGRASKGNKHALGTKWTDEQRVKHEAFRFSDESKAEMSRKRMGHPTSDATKELIRSKQVGEKGNNAKLTTETVKTIRDRYSKGGVTMAKLGTEFNICLSQVCEIINNHSWIEQ